MTVGANYEGHRLHGFDHSLIKNLKTNSTGPSGSALDEIVFLKHTEATTFQPFALGTLFLAQ